MSLTGSSDSQSPRRRRGAELEAALLDAAWQELAEKGFDDFTLEGCAERAQTSRAVFYRRWPGKIELINAAAVRAGSSEKLPDPDTGSLREDTLELLRHTNRSRARMGIQMMMRLGGYFEETGGNFADLRSSFLSRRGSAMDAVIERAAERGEVDPKALTSRMIAVPFDLYRQELIMTLKAVPEDVLEAIVDEVFLPLVTKR
jgi:AcrR family transcriptional regulator